ncbi:MAG: hypothetical protein MH825_01655 [Cyanobacteria bacterium]|nr:hypothetical protein [Cyanobacteriota bacterium]
MDSDDKFSSLDIDEVVNVHNDFRLCIGNQTFTVREFCTRIGSILANYSNWSNANFRVFWNSDQCAWFDGEGVPCNVLRFGDRAWQSGRVRLILEFCPAPPEEETVDVLS